MHISYSYMHVAILTLPRVKFFGCSQLHKMTHLQTAIYYHIVVMLRFR